MTEISTTKDWLAAIGLGQYVAVFAENDVDLDVAAELNDDDLRELGLSLGHRKKFLKAVAALGEDRQGTPPPANALRDPSAGAERRQLTVMFCDLVGSTALSTKLDVEDLRDVIGVYQDTCRDVVAAYGGFIARYMGDGILIYFGYPQAHDDDGDRALHTGIDVIKAVGALRPRPGLELQVRIGVATGVVIVGDIVGEGASEESAVLGETPNLAARLQSLAKPNTMVVSPETRRLVKDRFAFDDLGERDLKGIDKPVRAWGVAAAVATDDRFAAQARGTLIGRDEEHSLIGERWRRAVSGAGQAVLISGEAGIGKSRLVQAIKDDATAAHATVIHLSCSGYHTQHPLYPVTQAVARLLAFQDGDTPDRRLDRIEAFLAPREALAAAPIVAALFSVPVGERYPPHGLSAQALKQRTLEVLIDLLLGGETGAATLVVFDDAHWADQTSLELLTLALRSINRRAGLILVTARPEFVPVWSGIDRLTALNLQRLSGVQAKAVIAAAAGGKRLPDAIVATIIAKADGVPLFLEELTRNIVESGLLEDRGDSYALVGPLPPLAIPTTLHDSLMARLDRLPTAKEIAQIGAAIGRQFDYELIAAVTDLTDNELQDALARLRNAEIVYDDGAPPKATYMFKHALVQDAAYDSLLRRRRQHLHSRIVTALETKFPDKADTEPGVLGRHCLEAGLFAESARYYQKAGLVGALRSSMHEALAQLELGLGAAAKVEDTALRNQLELDLRMTLVFPLRALKGLGARDVEQNYARAFELARELGSNEHVLPVLYGLFAVVWARGDIAAASRRAEDLLAQANAANDPLSLVVAHYAVGLVKYFLGENDACLEHLDAVLAAYDPGQHAALALTFAIEFGVGAWNYRALCVGAMGRFGEARRNLASAVDLARALNHPFPLSHALGVGAATYFYLGDHAGMLDWTTEAIAVARAQGFAPYLAIALLCRGWAETMSGDHTVGLANLDEGIAMWQGGGYGLATPWFQVRHAEALVAAGRAADALALVGEALTRIDADPQTQFRPVALVVRGDAHRALGDDAAAENDYRAAATLAAAHGATGEELQAVTRLAHLLEGQERGADVRDRLGAVLDAVGSEESADVAEAQRLHRTFGASKGEDR